MIKNINIVLLLFLPLFVCGQSLFQEFEDFVKEENEKYSNEETSPLMPEVRSAFTGHEYYLFDKEYRVTASFKKSENAKPFEMKTSTERLPIYKEYGVATFTILGSEYSLKLYQSQNPTAIKMYPNLLFLPFTDASNGEETYGGGRYIDVKVSDANVVIIDFNTSYNPYCAYNKKYSCPIPPSENDLDIKILAGIKAPDTSLTKPIDPKVSELFEALGFEQEFKTLIAKSFEGVMEKETTDEFMKVIEAEFPVLRNQLLGVYSDVYNQEEVEGLLAFFKSELGQSYLAKSTSLESRSEEIVAAWAEPLFTELQADFYEEMAKLMDSPAKKCSGIKTGTFEITTDGFPYLIEITENEYKEIFEGQEEVYIITWKGECTYELSYPDSPEEVASKTTIYDVIGHSFSSITYNPHYETFVKNSAVKRNE